MFRYCAYSERGTKRTVNEDRVMADNRVLTREQLSGQTDARFMAVVCDGVGGTGDGARAAEMIVKSFVDFDVGTCTPRSVSRNLHEVNRSIVREKSRNPDNPGTASTVAGIVIKDRWCLSFNLGDTRILKYFDGRLSVISTDHTAATEWFCSGGCPDAITRYVGGEGFACVPSFRKGTAEQGSIFLLCTDGVYKGVRDHQLRDILAGDDTIEEKGKAILKLSLQDGSGDDRSLVLVECSACTEDR